MEQRCSTLCSLCACSCVISPTPLTVLQSQRLLLFCLSECFPLFLSAHLTGSGLAAGIVTIHRKQTGNMRAFVCSCSCILSSALAIAGHSTPSTALHPESCSCSSTASRFRFFFFPLLLARSLLRPHPKSNHAVFHLKCRCFPNHETISCAPQASRVDASDSPSSAPASTVRACCSRLL